MDGEKKQEKAEPKCAREKRERAQEINVRTSYITIALQFLRFQKLGTSIVPLSLTFK